MKKLLSILGSIVITASSASAVLACTTESKKDNNSNDVKSNNLTNESVDALKSTILADQYGMDLKKTKDRVSIDSDMSAPDFNEPDSSITKGMNLNGTLGKDNLPLYALGDQVNGLLSKVGVKKPVDFSSIINQWGGVIKEIPYLIESGNIGTVLGLIPTLLNNLTQLIPQDKIPNIPSGVITKIGEWIKDNIKWIVKQFDLNAVLTQMINKLGDNATVSGIYQAGVDALFSLKDDFFKGYSTEDGFDANKGDDEISAFLGTEILTPLLNGKDIDKGVINKLFNKDTLLQALPDLLDKGSQFLVAVLLRVQLYLPMMAKTPSDTDNLFDASSIAESSNNGTVFNGFEKLNISTSKDGKIVIDPNNKKISGNISLNKDLLGIINLMADDNPKDLSIFKLTNILFKSANEENPLLKTITNILVDSLKFTQYHVKFSTSVTLDIKVTKYDIDLDIDLYLKDLFTDGTRKTIATGLPSLIWLNMGDLTGVINVKNNGLLSKVDNVFEPLIENILLNKTKTNNWLESIIKTLLGTPQDDFSILLHGTGYDGLIIHNDPGDEAIPGVLWDAAWLFLGGKISPILDNILNTMWYWEDDGKKFFDALKNSGFMKDKDGATVDQQLASMKASMEKFEPLSKTVLNAMKNIQIKDKDGNVVFTLDLTMISKYVNFDALLNVLDILFLKNPIQDESTVKGTQFDFPDPDGTKSLAEQILTTLKYKPEQQAKLWSYYLGYIKPDDNKWDKNSTFVYRDGFIGSLVNLLYPELDNANDQVAGVLIPDDGKNLGQEINLDLLGLVHSDVLDAFDQAMKKFGDSLQGDSLQDIVDPLIDNKKVWKVSNVQNTYFNDSTELKYESYDLTFDTTGMDIIHTDKDGKVTHLPSKKVTYRVWFSRIDNGSTFSFKKIERLS